MKYSLTVNGRPHRVEAEADTPTLWVLRDLLHLKGAKYGCGIGQCGACTIHVDGRAVRSCIVPISAVKSAEITTIEGLSENGDHPVQRAWRAENVPQCGYCQSGQIMSAVALLRSSAHPTDDEIDASMSGNLCRCGTYPRIYKAIRRASQDITKTGSPS